MSSWKHGFKGHRIANSGLNRQDHFVYHRPNWAFPERAPVKDKVTAFSRLRWSVSSRLRTIRRWFLPGDQLLGVSAMSFVIPFFGLGVLYMFKSSAINPMVEVKKTQVAYDGMKQVEQTRRQERGDV
mmetsp:Transcript_11275/g.25681  ORF Transcript_11275/g.25681 Transcript_11275/m.25681 type:complete len:127 (+) Transcript_11275:54-434(+)